MLNLLETNLKSIDSIFTAKSGDIIEVLWLNVGKNCGHQIWPAEARRNTVGTV